MLRTTCVATMLQAGHADNALPQTARATVNCRILPGQAPEEVVSTLKQVIGAGKVTVEPLTPLSEVGSPPTKLDPEIMQAVKSATESLWPGVPVVPVMSQGATDGRYLRIAGMPVVGISGIADDSADIRAHGKDERVAASALFEGREFMYRLVNLLSKR